MHSRLTEHPFTMAHCNADRLAKFGVSVPKRKEALYMGSQFPSPLLSVPSQSGMGSRIKWTRPNPDRNQCTSRSAGLGPVTAYDVKDRGLLACHFSKGPSIYLNLTLLVMLHCLPGSRSVKPRGTISSSQSSLSLSAFLPTLHVTFLTLFLPSSSSQGLHLDCYHTQPIGGKRPLGDARQPAGRGTRERETMYVV